MRISRYLFRDILIFAGVLLALVLVLAWWSLGRALDSQAWARADEAARRLTLELDRETRGVSRLGGVLRAWWIAGNFGLASPDRLDSLVLPLLERQTSVSSINFCGTDGTSVLLLRTEGAWHTRSLLPGPGGNRLRWTRRSANGGEPTRGRWEPTAYDPRARDWYELVASGAEERWSPEAYRFMTTEDPGITLSFPVRSGGRLLGVLALDVLLDDLTGKAWEVQPTPGTRVVIADERGRALILPRRPPFQDRDARFRDFLRPVGPDVLPELSGLLADLRSVPEAGLRLRTIREGREYYGLVTPYRGPSGLTWYVAVAIPEAEIMADSRDKALGVLGFALFGFAVLSWRAWTIAQRFGRPLDSLASSTNWLRRAAAGQSPRDAEPVWEAVALQDALRLADRAVEEQMALREQLRSSQRRETIGTLASGIAHDVNNQLTVALGQIEPCIEALGPGHPLAPELVLAREAVLRCAETTKALLSYSRATTPSPPSAIELNRMLRSVSILLGRVLGGRITLVLDLAPELPHVAGIRVQLEQVVVNLVINARDAMPEGGTLTLRTALADDGLVRFTVSDTGVGMSPEVKARVFEPYFTTKAEGRGSGLGLSMVYGIVRSHGGRVEVESAEGVGTTFQIHLPPAREVDPPEHAPERGPRPVGLHGKRLLVADDEPSLRKILGEVLARAGASVTSAADGVEAAEIWRTRGPFDAVVTDLRMPRSSGLELYRAVRAGAPEVPFLLVSGLGLDDAGPALAPDRNAATLAKPYEGVELVRALGRLLERA